MSSQGCRALPGALLCLLAHFSAWASDKPVPNDFIVLHDPVVNAIGQVAFYGKRVGATDFDVYFLLNDLATPITASPAYDGSPAWHPSGSISFASDREGANRIYLRQFSKPTAEAIRSAVVPSNAHIWLPDGLRLLYEAREGDNHDIYLLDVETGSNTRLTDDAGNDFRPSYCEASERVVFQSNRGGNYQLYSVDLEGGDLEQLTDGEHQAITPSCGRLSNRVVFAQVRGPDDSRVAVVHPGGTELELLTNASFPTWGPNERSLVVMRDGRIYRLEEPGLPDTMTLLIDLSTEADVTPTR